MKVFIVGGTGFVGRATVAYLQGEGHSIVAWVRDCKRARNLMGGEVLMIENPSEQSLLTELEDSDVVINLSGESLASGRWTDRKKEIFMDSRVGVTSVLARVINECKSPPKVLISASAVGYYGDKGITELDEDSQVGDGYLANLCDDWESAALMAERAGTRVCLLRFGVILDREGGVLINLDRALSLSMSAYFGKGDQIIPWIHMIDVVRIINMCIEHTSIRGPINCTSPMPVTSKEFAEGIRDISKCKILLRIPVVLIRLLLGEGSNLLTYSHNAIPKKLNKIGYEFKYRNLKDALYEEFSSKSIEIKKYSDVNVLLEGHANKDSTGGINSIGIDLRKDVYRIHKGQYALSAKIELNRDARDVFSFFSSPSNLGFLTPSWMNFSILEVPDTIEAGARITYRIKLGILGIKWTTKIVTWQPDQVFVDIQESGPYSLWFHLHTVRSATSGLVEMEDVVIYRVPFGILGKLIHRLFIKKTLTRIFNYRRKVIQMRF